METNVIKNPSKQSVDRNGTISLLVVREAQKLLIDETTAYLNDDLETGGILVGRWLNPQTVLIVVATDAGPKADHQHLTFAVDVEYANERLVELRSLYSGVDYVGEWHKHPGSFSTPSGGDLHIAKQLINSPNYPARLINPIVCLQNGVVRVSYFYIDRELDNFIELQPKLLDLEEGLNLLKTLPTNQKSGLLDISTSSVRRAWWDTPNGKRRLQTELANLESHGYQVVTNSNLDDTTWIIRATTSKGRKPRNFEFQCYGNYPESRPGFVAFKDGKPYLQAESSSLAAWKPTTYLYQICQEVQNHRGGLRISSLGLVSALTLLILAAMVVLIVWQQQNTGQNRVQTTVVSLSNNEMAANSAATVTAAAVATAASNQDATAMAEGQLSATANASGQLTEAAIAATVQSQSAALTAFASGLPSKLTTLSLTPAPTVSYTLTVSEISQDIYNQLLTQGKHSPTPFHLIALLGNPSLATQNLKLLFPSGYAVSLSSAGQSLTMPFNDAGLGCQSGNPCTISVIDSQNEQVSNSVSINSYDPNGYYLFVVNTE